MTEQPLKCFMRDIPKGEKPQFGFFSLWEDNYYFFVVFAVPIPVVLSLLLPLSVGPFIRFRFPLWSYFAWTALIAAELAYYLR